MANNESLPDPNRLAEMCLLKFGQLPKTGKPIPNMEWTVLSCIAQYNRIDDTIDVVALGTGNFIYIRIHSQLMKILETHSKLL